MNRYSVLLWLCVLFFLVLPWLLATIFTWVYAEGFEEQGRETEGDRLGYVSAILQTSSSIIYIVFIFGALVCIGVVGRPQSHCSYLCLVLGIPVFFTVPVVGGILVLISALNNQPSTARNIGLTAVILSFVSTLPCCWIVVCALACGSRGKGRHSRYPLPLAYIPILGEWEQKEDKWEATKARREFTDNYPSESPPGPLPSYKAERLKVRNANNKDVKSDQRSSSKSKPYFRDIGHDESNPPKSNASRTQTGRTSVGPLPTIREDSQSEDHHNVSEKERSDKDNSNRKFSLTAFLNSRRKSSPASLDTQEKSPTSSTRRHFEPESKIGASKESGETLTTLKVFKPNADT